MKGPALEIARVVRQVLAEMAAGPATESAGRRVGESVRGQVGQSANRRIESATSGRDRDGTGWQFNGRVITLADLDGRLNGNKEIAIPGGAIVTPLARDYLSANGVEVRRIQHAAGGTASDSPTPPVSPPSKGGDGRLRDLPTRRPADLPTHRPTESPTRLADSPPRSLGGSPAVSWAYAVLNASPLCEAAVQGVKRAGPALERLVGDCLATVLEDVVERLAGQRLCGAVLFCDDATLLACAANKRGGVRAAVGASLRQVVQAVEKLAINVLAVEPAGKTLHELRGMLRAFCSGAGPRHCPEGVAALLQQPAKQCQCGPSAGGGVAPQQEGECRCASAK